MQKMGTYKPEYDDVIGVYAELMEQYRRLTAEFGKGRIQIYWIYGRWRHKEISYRIYSGIFEKGYPAILRPITVKSEIEWNQRENNREKEVSPGRGIKQYWLVKKMPPEKLRTKTTSR